jgi:putative flippase GtrA
MVVGGLNTGIDLAVFFLLVEGLDTPIVLANVLSYSTGVFNSFFFNKHWSFAGRSSDVPIIVQLPMFVAVNLISMVLSTGALWWLAGILPVWLAKVLGTSVGFSWNFLVSRQVVFRPAKTPHRLGDADAN